ncbi:HYD1 signature containing ADP-ribosyltransferase family protein [Burkholderia cepacia]|uniref:HYD1 signature containing ADP-ribosyltransferase family protein n=1 Tax=Burkholderia cepacia TaxID=292 RepID=UPI0018C6C0C0|nr:HYD1 signature containing ADP-ribosyltransferase family protein [Burkholderia cepacia]
MWLDKGRAYNAGSALHYRKGSNAIRESGVIKARDNNRVYVEPGNKKPLSQLDAETKYQIKRGRGRDYVEMDVPNSKLEWVKNPRYGTEELTVKGDIPLTNPEIVQRR